jgi:hypothetical protein
MRWGNGLALLTLASIARQRGDVVRAIAHTTEAERLLDESGMSIYTQAARRRRGELIGGDEGRALVDGADAWMREQTVLRPARITAMLMPGQWRVD